MKSGVLRCWLGIGMFLLLMCTNSFPVFANQKIIEADGYYTVGDGLDENFSIAKERAKYKAMQNASEQACVFVESISMAQAGKLSQDEIRTISANVLQLNENPKYSTETAAAGTVIRIHCHVTVVVDDSNVLAILKQDKKELDEAVEHNKELEKEIARINRENEELKVKFATARSDEEKQKLREQSKENDKDFQAALYYEIGNQMMSQKDRNTNNYNYNGAIENYLKSLSINPNQYSVWNRLGGVYFVIGNCEKAVECYTKAISINPKEFKAWIILGISYKRLGKYDKAIDCYNKAISKNSRDSTAWHNMGSSYKAMGNYKKAIECYNRVLEIDPKSNYVWSQLARVYSKLGNRRKAISCYIKETKQNPFINGKPYKTGGKDVWFELGNEYSNVGEQQKSIECYTKAIETDPNFAAAYNNRGSCYENIRDYKNAKADYNKAYELNPNNQIIAQNKKRSQKW